MFFFDMPMFLVIYLLLKQKKETAKKLKSEFCNYYCVNGSALEAMYNWMNQLVHPIVFQLSLF